MKKTLVVNLLGGAGVGKSTLACKTFALLKEKGLDCELVLEYVKDMVYEGRSEIFKCQPYIFGKQLFKIFRFNGKVDVISTDSPIFLDIVYDEENDENFRQYVLKQFNKFNNLNIYLNRTVSYQTNGRLQDEEEAIKYDTKVKYWLNELQVPYFDIDVDKDSSNKILESIISRLIVDKIYETQTKIK